MNVLPEPTHDDGESIACPWCNHRHGDLWDYSWGSREEIEVECHDCERPFTLSRRVSVSYTATAVKEGA